ncbi:uncharacterized protein LOC135930280 [Gordionus sp. m RMFG-2023]|uniref:uncharacterized protein LOC135930280 n=1 Tax=Gordionus sp. m RMFG-2023 TaxID=3053472 RepID=UPI0031FDD549
MASLVIATSQIQKNQILLHKMSYTESKIEVLRNNTIQNIASSELVPGDIVKLKSNSVLTCDLILLNGSCIVNESLLTGESIPITKTALPLYSNCYKTEHFDKDIHFKHILFCGTKLIQTRYYDSEYSKAIVIRTGYQTVKGNIIKSIKYSSPNEFHFDQDCYKFIVFLFFVAFVGFVYTIILKLKANVEPIKIILRAFDIITIVVPPTLPAAMAVGIIYANKRLEKLSIHCLSPAKINVCGVIDTICFDKTGTLTEQVLDVMGFIYNTNPIISYGFSTQKHISKSQSDSFKFKPLKDFESVSSSSSGNFMEEFDTKIKITECMAACHSLTLINENGNCQISGDPLEIKMFEHSGWEIVDKNQDSIESLNHISELIKNEEPMNEIDMSQHLNDVIYDNLIPIIVREKKFSNHLTQPAKKDIDHVHPPLTCKEMAIIRQLPFLSSLQRMSVVIRMLGSPTFEVYCKGAPEKIKELCHKSSIPIDFESYLDHYTSRGYRVLSLAWKPLPTFMKWPKIQKLNRNELEKDLHFLGFMIFENKLKPNSRAVIDILKQAKIDVFMVTGDNLLTAIYTAKQCSLIDYTAHENVVVLNRDNLLDYFSSDFYEENRGNKKDYCKKNIKSANWNLFRFINKARRIKSSLKLSKQPLPHASYTPDICFAVTGDVYESILMREYDDYQRDFKNMNAIKIDLEYSNTKNGTFEIPLTLNYPYQTSNHLDKSEKINDHIIGPKIPNNLSSALRALISCGRVKIFARMGPEVKAHLIHNILAPSGRYVMMCGDGANDCSALKSAHVGVALTSSPASSDDEPFTKSPKKIVYSKFKFYYISLKFLSLYHKVMDKVIGCNDRSGKKLSANAKNPTSKYASCDDNEENVTLAAPFLAKGRDISCVLELIREGRCSLGASFGLFQYSAISSLLQFGAVLMLHWNGANLSDPQFVYLDLCTLTLIAVLFGRAGPPSLSRYNIDRPLSVIGHDTKTSPIKHTEDADGLTDSSLKRDKIITRKSCIKIAGKLWNDAGFPELPSLSCDSPRASLVSGPALFSLFSQTSLHLLFLVLVRCYVIERPWFEPYNPEIDVEEDYLSHEVTAIFLVSALQYLTLAVTLYESSARGVRVSLWEIRRNSLLLIALFCLTINGILMIMGFFPAKLQNIMFLQLPPSLSARLVLLSIVFYDFCITLLNILEPIKEI